MKRIFKIFRGGKAGGEYQQYELETQEGMVVLDAVHQIQAEQEPDLAVRWNCKAGKCGSCSAEVNGRPALMCMTRLSSLPDDKPIVISPMKAFPVIRDLVTDVSWNYEVNKKIPPFRPAAGTDAVAAVNVNQKAVGATEFQDSRQKHNSHWRMYQHDVDRVQEFRKCIECFLCQDTCHVLRTHSLHDEFFGPRFFVRVASLDMHPLDTVNREELLKKEGGLAYCNITKCCTEVCPEEIRITDNAIIPMKERVAGRFYDPLRILLKKLFGQKRGQKKVGRS